MCADHSDRAADNYFLFAPWAFMILGVYWTLERPDPGESGAGVVIRYNGTYDDRPWVLLGWSDTNPPSTAPGPFREVRWTLSRHGLAGPQHEKPGTCDVLSATQWASEQVDAVSTFAVREANLRGEYCARASDLRHDSATCPGQHS